jgi:hypothetical protein
MKKALLFFVFSFVLGAFAANAQSCHGSAAAGKSCCADKAAKAAAADPSIEKRSNDDGSVAYVRKEADAQGNVQFVSVKYDETANAFVGTAPAVTDKTSMTKKTASCTASASSGKACCAGKTAEAGKSCAGSSASSGKACCAGKTASSCEKKAEQ